MSYERRESYSPGTERLAKAVYHQTEWLLLKFQNALERNKVIYMETDVDGVLSNKRARKVSVVLYLMAVTFFAVSVGTHYAFIWKPCPKNFFYKSPQLCTQGCANEEYFWNKMSWYEGSSSNCGNKTLSCTSSKRNVTSPLRRLESTVSSRSSIRDDAVTDDTYSSKRKT